MGKAAARHPVVNYKQVLGTSSIPPVPFPSTNDRRPLAGIKIVEIGRVIALPAAGALLAALGAGHFTLDDTAAIYRLTFGSLTKFLGSSIWRVGF